MNSKVLIISKDAQFLNKTAAFLSLSNFSITKVSTGTKAIEVAKSLSPQVVVCSHHLPDFNGEQVLCLLREDEFLRGVIFIGLGDDQKLFRQYMNLGADDFLPQPVDKTLLLNTIKLKLQLLKSREEKPFAVKYIIDQTDTVRNELADFAVEEQTLKVGEYLFQNGGAARFLFFLREGRIKTSLLDDKGNELLTNLFTTGDFIGFKPLIEEREYLKEAVALEDCVLDKIPSSSVFNILLNEPKITKGLLLNLSKQYTETEEDLLSIAYSSVKKRLAHKLIQFCDEQKVLNFKIAREDLANMLGTSTETAVRALTDLKKEKLVSTYGSKIIVKNLSGLRQKFEL